MNFYDIKLQNIRFRRLLRICQFIGNSACLFFFVAQQKGGCCSKRKQKQPNTRQKSLWLAEFESLGMANETFYCRPNSNFRTRGESLQTIPPTVSEILNVGSVADRYDEHRQFLRIRCGTIVKGSAGNEGSGGWTPPPPSQDFWNRISFLFLVVQNFNKSICR